MLILASASPRRQELLRNALIPFSVQVSDVTEEHRAGESPEHCVRRLAREKAAAIAKRSGSGDPILAADTEVVIDLESGTPLGKPRNADDAARMLGMLSGRTHYVITGVCLMWRKNEEWQVRDAAEVTRVFMRELSEKEILDYVATAEPMDKAGAYAIQGIASRWIHRIEGCYFNVVGLPVPLVYRMLQEHAPDAMKE
jgi:nucleoside triphosphate pyrophosphatase